MQPNVTCSLKKSHVVRFPAPPPGAGKTYTLTSIEPDSIGMMPRAANEIFNDLEHDQLNDCTVYMSYIQIYMEIIKDLLKPASNNLSIREDQ